MKKTSINTAAPACLLATILAVAPGASPAQTEARSQSGTPAIEEVIVTAQKRAENLMSVPISITAISAKSLSDIGAKSLNEFNAVAPGITFTGNTGHGISNISVRGVSGASAYMLEDPVAIYTDGSYQFNQTFGINALSDIASIEVVRGPQGTLQGRNATAGALLIRTADPEEQFGGYLTAAVASEEEYRVQGAITGPLSSELAARLALDYIDERGWGHNSFDGNHLGGNETFNARAILLWTPDEALRARLALNYQSSQISPAIARWSILTINPDPAAPALVPAASPPTGPLPEAQRNLILDDDEFALNRRTSTRIDTPGATLEVSYDLGAATLVSITSAHRHEIKGSADSDGTALFPREGYNQQDTTGSLISEELRLQSNGEGELTWILGGYASRIEHDLFWDIHNHRYTVPAEVHTLFTADQTYLSYAGFADATYKLTDSFSLTGGVRYTHEEKDFSSSRTALTFPLNAPLAPVFNYTPPAESWDDVSYRAVASFTPRDGFLAYASFSKGFKSGGFNAFSPDPAFAPEKLYSYEIGMKVDLFDGRGRALLSAYDSDYENLQVSSGVPTGGFIIRNAAEAEIRGLEIEAEGAVSDTLRVTGNVAYIDAEYVSFPNAPNVFGIPVDASGSRLLRTPEWQYFAQIVHTTPIGSAWRVESQASWRWRDTIYFTATNQDAPNLRSEPSGELGARISFHNDTQDLVIAVFGNNLTNERVPSNVSLTFARPLATFNKPLIYGLELTKRF